MMNSQMAGDVTVDTCATAVTHASEVKMATRMVSEYLAGFGEKAERVGSLEAGDSFNIDMQITGTDEKLVAGVQVHVHCFLKPVDKTSQSLVECR